MLTLKTCKVGVYFEIQKIESKLPLKMVRRLCDLGFTPGQKVRLLRKSLLGKVLLVELRGYTLSIRGELAKAVLVQ